MQNARTFANLAAGILLVSAARIDAGGGLPPIVFVSRAMDIGAAPERTSPIERAREGKLIVLLAGGTQRVLVDAASPESPRGAPLDVSDPSVSYDAETIVFSGYSAEESAWRIYEVRADGSGLRQVTRSDRQLDLTSYGEAAPLFEDYDDVDPCYLPDGRMVFVSTRYPGLAPSGRLRATNLHVVNADGSGLRRITSERFGADTPAVDPTTGKIVYSRWWLTPRAQPPRLGGSSSRASGAYGPSISALTLSPIVLRSLDDARFAGVNHWFLASVNPDGSGLAMFSGPGPDRELTMAYRPSFLEDGSALTLFIRESPFLGLPGSHGLRRTRPGPGIPEALGGPQTFGFRGDANRPDPNPAAVAPPFRAPGFFYASAEALGGGRILVTGYAVDPPGLPAEEPNFDLHVQEDASSPPAFLFGASDRQELDAVPLVPRAPPAVIRDRAPELAAAPAPRTVEEAFALNGSFSFVVENIHGNAPVDVLVANAPPVGRELTMEFYMNPQRSGVSSPDPPLLIGRREVGPDGRVEMELPAGVPLFEVLRRPDGDIALGRDGQAFHVGGMNFGAAGQAVRCVGCHSGHSQMPVPDDPSWTNLAPSAVVTASSTRTERLPDSDGGDFTFAPTALVNRRTDEVASEWAAEDREPTVEVRLRWRLPINAREVSVYGTRAGEGRFGPRDQTIRAFTVALYLGVELRQELPVATPVRPGGTTVSLDPSLLFDELAVSIRAGDVSGLFEGRSGVALAEVEVIGRVALGAPATIAMVRGDADCSEQTNVSDAIVVLNRLFRGAGPLCCEAAGDVNDNGRLDLSDAVHLLLWLYRGGLPPAEPSPRCGRALLGALSCEVEVCP
jgi:hypothetical protein